MGVSCHGCKAMQAETGGKQWKVACGRQDSQQALLDPALSVNVLAPYLEQMQTGGQQP